MKPRLPSYTHYSNFCCPHVRGWGAPGVIVRTEGQQYSLCLGAALAWNPGVVVINMSLNSSIQVNQEVWDFDSQWRQIGFTINCYKVEFENITILNIEDKMADGELGEKQDDQMKKKIIPSYYFAITISILVICVLYFLIFKFCSPGKKIALFWV